MLASAIQIKPKTPLLTAEQKRIAQEEQRKRVAQEEAEQRQRAAREEEEKKQAQAKAAKEAEIDKINQARIKEQAERDAKHYAALAEKKAATQQVVINRMTAIRSKASQDKDIDFIWKTVDEFLQYEKFASTTARINLAIPPTLQER